MKNICKTFNNLVLLNLGAIPYSFNLLDYNYCINNKSEYVCANLTNPTLNLYNGD